MISPSLKVLQALAHPIRLEIVSSLEGRDEVTCQELSKKFDLSQPTMSHHFNKLVKAKVLLNRREKTLWFYSLNQPYLHSIGIIIKDLLCA